VREKLQELFLSGKVPKIFEQLIFGIDIERLVRRGFLIASYFPLGEMTVRCLFCKEKLDFVRSARYEVSGLIDFFPDGSWEYSDDVWPDSIIVEVYCPHCGKNLPLEADEEEIERFFKGELKIVLTSEIKHLKRNLVLYNGRVYKMVRKKNDAVLLEHLDDDLVECILETEAEAEVEVKE